MIFTYSNIDIFLMFHISSDNLNDKFMILRICYVRYIIIHWTHVLIFDHGDKYKQIFREVSAVRFTLSRHFSNVVVATRHGEDFRQLGHAWNLAGAEIREFIVAVRRIKRARHRAAQRVASRSLIRCVGASRRVASWRRVTNDNAAVTSSVRDAVSLTLRNDGEKERGREREEGVL